MSETQAAPPQSLEQRQSRIDALTSREFSPAQVDVMRNTICRGATNDELALFIAVAGRTGLDPFTKQIHLVKRWDSASKAMVMAIQVGIDGFRVVAQRSKQYGGRLGPWWCGPDGKWREVWLEDGPPAAARVGIIRRDFTEPVFAIARWSAYVQTKKDGDVNSMWDRMDAEQLAKCAEALVLRVAFPNDLSGLYTEDEIPSVPHIPLTATDYNERERARLAAEQAPARAMTEKADAALTEALNGGSKATPEPSDDPKAEFIAIGERTGRRLTGKGSGQAMAAWLFAIAGYAKLADVSAVKSTREVTPAQWAALRDAARRYEQEKHALDKSLEVVVDSRSVSVEVAAGATTEAMAGPTEPESENPEPSLEQQGEDALSTVAVLITFCEKATAKFAAAGTPREFAAKSGAFHWLVDAAVLEACGLDTENPAPMHRLTADDRKKAIAEIERSLDKLAARKMPARGPAVEGRLL